MSEESLAGAAVRDLQERTLSSLRGELAKLVYLASTRDYNTGQYRHEGLALIHTPTGAEEALKRCHEEIFREVALLSIAEIKQEIEIYLESTGEDREKVLEAWQKLEAYRVLMPAGFDELAEGMFILKVRIALAALHPSLTAEWQRRSVERPLL